MVSPRNRPVGIFDSGIGGLTVFKEIRTLLPAENLYYLGDTARVPYGTKSPEVVRSYAESNIRFLLERGAKVVVVACNTASATALDHVRRTFPNVPMIGVIDPVIKCLSAMPDAMNIGVIGTTTTINSGVYQSALRAQGKMVIAKACPLFVPLVEEGVIAHPLVEQVIDYYLAEFRVTSLDTLVLGCTHYPLLRPALADYFRHKVQILDSARSTADALRGLLIETGLLSDSSDMRGEERFFVTDAVENFQCVGERFLGRPLSGVEHI